MKRKATNLKPLVGCCRHSVNVIAGLLVLITGWSSQCLAFQSGDDPANHEMPNLDMTLPDPQDAMSNLASFDLDSIRLNLTNANDLMLESEGPLNGRYDPPSVFLDVLSVELETSRQVEELGSRIMKLIKLEQDQRRRQMLEVLTAPANDVPPANDASANESSNGSESDFEELVAPENSLVTDAEGDMDGERIEMASDGEASRPDRPKMKTTRILSEPPDQLALADNLFFSGETDLALELYQNSKGKSSTKSDKTWISFQIASCQRRLGNTDEAKRILRSITEGTENDPVVANARWWLDAIDRKEQLGETLSLYKQFIDNKESGNAIDQ